MPSGLPVYYCNFCSVRYQSFISLKRHVLSCHEFRVSFKLICNINGCPEKLNGKLSLRKHIYRKHKGKRWEVPKTWYKKVLVMEDRRQPDISGENLSFTKS